ncbi:hypothetical protein R6Q59_009996 [Mikania micrantha]
MPDHSGQGGFNFTSTLRDDTYDFINPNKLNLSGKNVFISGASRGVGQAMAISYAKAGASGIALAARSSLEKTVEAVKSAAEESGRSPPKVLTVKCDTTSTKDAESAAKQVGEEFGAVDILINNAGFLENFVPIVESDPDEWWKTFEVNVKGVYLMTRAFLPLVLKSNLKTIVQTSSIGAHITTPGASSYLTTKQAVLRLNNFVHAENVDKGLLTYSIHPGAVMTELAKGMPKAQQKVLKDTPELCGDVVPWLTSERREWLADRYVSVTWDMEEFLGKKDEIVSKDLLKMRMRE